MAERLLVTPVPQQRTADTCQLYLVRHGTTVPTPYRGRRDVPLDTRGYQDAFEAAERLAQAGLAAVYAGPLRRTIATAQIISERAGVPDVRILSGLNNLDYGAWEGLTTEEAAMLDPAAFALYRSDPSRAACPMGERLSDAQERIIDAVRLIGSRHAGQAVVAVTHAVMIRLVLVNASQADDDVWRLPVRTDPVTELWLRDGAIDVRTILSRHPQDPG